MNAKANRYILTQASWDSGRLTPLASVMHRFQEPGQYQGIVLHGTETVGLFDLVVDEKSPEAQVNIDLEAVYQRRYAQTGGGNPFVVNPRQPTAFYVARGRGGYAVVVYRSDAGRRAAEFDSRELKDGDVFTLTPIRRGIYSATNKGAAKGEIQVQKRKGRSIPTQPVIIECTEKGFKPEKAKAEFSQPLFYVIKTPSRITIQLEQQPDDEPGSVRRRSTPRKKEAA
ncbi:MAG TPA: hypothetical protein VJ793_19545 [Anaerolineae bacterium]|nr:hypothetical protein [Anaerolineae bacterium]